MTTTQDRAIHLIAEHAGKRESEIRLEHRLVGDLYFDSLDRLELIMSLEEEFEIEVDDDEAIKFGTVADVVSYVDRCLAPA